MAVVIIVLVVGIVPWMAIILDLMVLACASFAWHFPLFLVEFHSTPLTLAIPYLQIYYFLATSLYSRNRYLKIMPTTSAYSQYECLIYVGITGSRPHLDTSVESTIETRVE